MTKDLHAASNAVIAKVMDKEVTIKMTRSEAAGLAMVLRDAIYRADELTTENYLQLSLLHKKLRTAE